MNLFVVSHSAGAGADAAKAGKALSDLLTSVPFLSGAEVERWSSPSGVAAAAWAQHRPESIGGVRHAVMEPARLALFTGRPIRWTGEWQADGRGPLDPRSYLADEPTRWASELDGRFAVARYEDSGRSLELVTDPLGGYPLYCGAADGTCWIANNAELVRSLCGISELDPEVLASVFGGGWSVTGHPAWRGVERLPPGSLIAYGPDGARRVTALHPRERYARMPGAGPLDPTAAARTLTATVRALADWPGRPTVVPITSGRDSRLILAAALHAGIDFSPVTAGAPEDLDVVGAKRVCRAAGLEHELIGGDPDHNLLTHPVEAARLVGLSSGGTATLADGSGFPMADEPGPRLLWHTGLAGEVARGFYEHSMQVTDRDWRRLNAAGIAKRLYRSFAGRRPGRREPLTQEAQRAVGRCIHRFVAEQLELGAAPSDVPDLFYLLNRMPFWCGPALGAVEWIVDPTTALLSPRQVPHLLGLPLDERAADRYHLLVMRQLAPQLVDVPFGEDEAWPPVRGALGRRLAHWRRLSRRGSEQAARRLTPLRRRRIAPESAGVAPPAPPDPFAAVHARLRDTALSEASHPAWQVLDRRATEALLSRDPAGLDAINRYYVWRIATAFWGLRSTGK